MPEYVPYRPELAGELASLWEIVFGDPAVLVRQFLRLWRDNDFVMAAVSEGHVASAAYCLPGLEILRPGMPALPARYLYAVATHPDYRKQGLAAALCRMLRDECFSRGELLLTKPADASLYSWYEEKIGAAPILHCRTMRVSMTAHGTVTPLSWSEYAAHREHLLSGTPHVRLPDALFQWEHLLHESYGGGFFAVNDAIADVYANGIQLELPELLSASPEQDVATLLSHFSIPAATVTLPGADLPYVSCAASGHYPDQLDSVWFGPVFG